jgi:hypothetical protein
MVVDFSVNNKQIAESVRNKFYKGNLVGGDIEMVFDDSCSNRYIKLSNDTLTRLKVSLKKRFDVDINKSEMADVCVNNDGALFLRFGPTLLFIAIIKRFCFVYINGEWVNGGESIFSEIAYISSSRMVKFASSPGLYCIRDSLFRSYKVGPLVPFVDDSGDEKLAISLTSMDFDSTNVIRHLDSFVGFQVYKTKNERRREMVSETYNLLKEKHAFLFAKPYRPLAIGIHKQIIAMYPQLTANSIKRALSGVVRHPLYSKAIIEGSLGPRFNLDNSENGVVTHEHLLGAIKNLKFSLCNYYERYTTKLGVNVVDSLMELAIHTLPSHGGSELVFDKKDIIRYLDVEDSHVLSQIHNKISHATHNIKGK